ncbi:MAG: hypothetical protein FWD11_06825, partial [Micrococcales bacterium]|nr:hypothetical protein [Micrococcales bacterium]
GHRCGYAETGPEGFRVPFRTGSGVVDTSYSMSASVAHPFVVAVPDAVTSADEYAELSDFVFLLWSSFGIEPCEPEGWCSKSRDPIPTEVGWERP